jgi:hypothetical protein
MERGLTKNQIINELTRSTHGKLAEYVKLGVMANDTDPEFLAHLIAWNRFKGQVRDSKVALPVVALLDAGLDEELVDNAFAHIATLGPRELLKAYHFALDLRDADFKLTGRMTAFRRLIAGYLWSREKNWPAFERLLVQHRIVIRDLFSITHTVPSSQDTKACLWRSDKFDGVRKDLPYPAGGLFEAIQNLSKMSPIEAAGTIITRGIPFLVVSGAFKKLENEPELVLALLTQMSPTEVQTNAKTFEKLCKGNPALRGALQKALDRVGESTATLLKTTEAIDASEDEAFKETLRAVQEKQMKLAGVEGSWIVLADKSRSMQAAIAIAQEVAATLAAMVKGKVWLTFFDSHPMVIDVTSLALDQIKKATRHIVANGATSIGCGLQRLMDEDVKVDGIVVVSDAKENTPPTFAQVYKNYSALIGKEVPVYLYRVATTMTNYSDTDLATSMKEHKFDLQEFDLRDKSFDYVSLPNLVKTMRTSRYSLIDEIMAAPLLKLDDVYKTPEKAFVSQ